MKIVALADEAATRLQLDAEGLPTDQRMQLLAREVARSVSNDDARVALRAMAVDASSLLALARQRGLHPGALASLASNVGVADVLLESDDGASTVELVMACMLLSLDFGEVVDLGMA